MEPIDERVARMEVKLDDLRELMVARFEQVDRQFAHVDGRFEQVDKRFEQVDARLDRMDRRFLWLLGMQFTTLLAIVAGLFGVVATLVATR